MKKKTNPIKEGFSLYLTILIPLLYVYNIFLAYRYPHTFTASIGISFIGLICSIAGVALWVLSFYYLGFSFGVLPQKQKRVTRGVYAYLSHPMYVGIWLTFVGLSLANMSLPGLLFLTLVMTPLLFIRGSLEDKKLYN